MIYGMVVDAGEGDRRAAVDVISYAGPSKSPMRILMPETIDDRHLYPVGYECPDFPAVLSAI